MLKKYRIPRKIVMLLLALTVVFIAGCQAIGGVDLNKMIKNTMKVTSIEGKQTIHLLLDLDEEALEMEEEAVALLNLVSNVKIELDNLKVQNSEHFSFDGNLLLGDVISIGFSLKMSDTLAVFELEGAKHPYMVDLTAASTYGAVATYGMADMMGSEPEFDQEAATAFVYELLDVIGGYTINNLPNPKSLNIAPTSESINGINTFLMHAEVKMDGTDIFEWGQQYVDALVSDSAGLERMLSGIVDVITSNKQFLEEAVELMFPYGIEEFYGIDITDEQMLKELVEEASESITDALREVQAELQQSEYFIETIINDSLVVKADFYVDSKLDIRKQLFEVSYTREDDAMFIPIKGITLKSEGEFWNVNGDVEPAKPILTDETLDFIELMDMDSGYRFLNSFEEDSVIYDFLKHDLHIGRQTYVVYDFSIRAPIMVANESITLVPIRDVANAFGAITFYDEQTRSVTIYDEPTDMTIVVQVGSDTAVINGEQVQWSYPVIIVDGSAYVAARSLSNAFDATIEWKPSYDDRRTLEIQREF